MVTDVLPLKVIHWEQEESESMVGDSVSTQLSEELKRNKKNEGKEERKGEKKTNLHFQG